MSVLKGIQWRKIDGTYKLGIRTRRGATRDEKYDDRKEEYRFHYAIIFFQNEKFKPCRLLTDRMSYLPDAAHKTRTKQSRTAVGAFYFSTGRLSDFLDSPSPTHITSTNLFP